MWNFCGLFTRILLIHFGAILLYGLLSRCSCEDVDLIQITEIPTVTVRGFLNFRTTVDGTVIVFTPASELPKVVTHTRNTLNPSDEQPSRNAIDNEVLTSKESVHVNIQDITYTQPPSLPDRIQPAVSEVVTLGGPKVKDHYDHLHLSDNVVIPSAIHTDNDLETAANKKISPAQNPYPTGLVTVLNGMNVEGGKTTMYETKVVGTYIDGKYAQILQSTSKIVPVDAPFTPSYRTIGKAPSSDIKSNTVAVPLSTTTQENLVKATSTFPVITVKSSTPNIISIQTETRENHSHKSHTIELQSSLQRPEMSLRVDPEPTQRLDVSKTRLPVKLRSSNPVISSTVIRKFDDEDILHSSKNHRQSSSPRIRFTTLRRPSQTVRLNRFKVRLTLRQNATDGDATDDDEQEDEQDHSSSELLPHGHQEESIDLDIDPANVVYRETTITSQVTLHVGRRKSIRTLTITTSVPMRINPTETHEITGITHNLPPKDHDLDTTSTASQSVVTRSFTTTERTETTTVVPVFDGTTTTDHVLTESFFIMKIVTVYRTLPPGDVTIVAFDDDSTEHQEVSATTLDVAANVQPTSTEISDSFSTINTAEPHIQPSESNSEHKNNMNSGMTDPILSFGQALSNNPLAAVYLGLQQLNAQMTLYSTITQTTTLLATDTIYSTKTIRYYDGRSTRFRTTSEPISTKKRTVTTTITSLQPYINTQAFQQQQHLQKLIAATRMAVPQPQYSTLTSIYATSTTATSLSTRIYTLIYNGFSTKFRTVTSTKTYPTVLTITSTKEVPIAMTHPPLLPFAYPYPAA